MHARRSMNPRTRSDAKYVKALGRYYSTNSLLWQPGDSSKARVEAGLSLINGNIASMNARILDLCCGGGSYLFALGDRQYVVVGVDILRSFADEAQQRASDIGSPAQLCLGDVRSLMFENKSFDAALLMGNSLPHFSMKGAQTMAEEVHRTLNPGGILVCGYADMYGTIFGTQQGSCCELSTTGQIHGSYGDYDPEKGVVSQDIIDVSTGRKSRITLHLWTPFFLRHLMNDAGFQLKATRFQPNECHETFVDIFVKK